MNEVLLAFYAQFDDKAIGWCNKFTLEIYNSPDNLNPKPCTKEFSNLMIDLKVTDFNKEYILKNTDTNLYSYSDLVMTGGIKGNNPIEFYALATSRWGV